MQQHELQKQKRKGRKAEKKISNEPTDEQDQIC